MRRYTAHAVGQRIVQVQTRLEDFGDLRWSDSGSARARRRLLFELDAPGYDLPTAAYFKYAEWYVRRGDEWELVKYHYDYFDRALDHRFAYHRHDVGKLGNVAHSHCGPASEDPPAHYRSYEVTLWEANEEFMDWYAGDLAVDCTGMRPLEPEEAG